MSWLREVVQLHRSRVVGWCTRLLSMLLIAFALNTNASAYVEELCKIPEADSATITQYIPTSMNALKDVPWNSYIYVEAKNGSYYLMMDSLFNELTSSEKLSIFTFFVGDLNSWDLTATTKQAIYTKVSSYIDDYAITALPELIDATTADMQAAYAWWYPFHGVVGSILGVAVVLIMIFLIIATVIDLTYLGNAAMIQQLTEQDRPRFVSRDAVEAVEHVVKENTGQNVYFVYLKSRWITYILFAICIFYLISGQIGDIIGYFMSIGEGIAN